MYNKLFTKILDSSVWLEPTPTRIVWVTLIAAMDEVGIARFASVANVAHRARVTVEEAEVALRCLEQPDVVSPEQEAEGRRIERVPDGWLVLNAEKYRQLVTKAVLQEQTRLRVRRHRAAQRNARNATSLHTGTGNASVTPSEADQIRSEEEKKEPLGCTHGHDSLSQQLADQIQADESARRRRKPFR